MIRNIKKNTIKLILIIITFLILFNSIFPTVVMAADLGGILFKATGTFWNIVIAVSDITFGIYLKGPSQVFEDGKQVVNDIIQWLQEKADNDEEITEGETVDDVEIVDIMVGPDTIFSGKIDVLNANIFKSNDEGFAWGEATLGQQLRSMVAQIYIVLRNICAIVLLIALLYTGINILITHNLAARKAQWMESIQNWMIGLILLIFSHIIMITIFYVSDTLVLALQDSIGSSNFMQTLIVKCFKSWDMAEQIIYLIMLTWLFYLTVVFAISYFKRLFYICLLTILAPVVSVMYAFGKGTRSIYQNWFKDYLKTVLIQPMHIIMYYVLISIPLGIANGTPGNFWGNSITGISRLIYALIGLTFIKGFEQLINKLFGMDQGVAAMASKESGAKTLVNGIKAAVAAKMASKGGAIAAKMAGKGAKAANAANKVNQVTETADKLGKKDGSLDPILEKYHSDGFNKNVEGHYFNPSTNEYDESYDPHKDKLYNSELEKKPEEKKTIGNEEVGNKDNSLLEGKISQITINGLGSINVNGLNDIEGLDGENGENKKSNIDNANVELDKDQENETDKEQDNPDMNYLNEYLKDSGKGRFVQFIEKGAEVAKKGYDFTQTANFRDNFGKIQDSMMELEQGNAVTIGGSMGGLDQTAEKYVSDKYKENSKKKKEKSDSNFVNNEKNINYVIQKNDLMEKYRKKYPNKSEEYIKDKAKEDAKARLKEMTPYVDKGLTNIESISALYQFQKETGKTPDETIHHFWNAARNERNFKEFDGRKKNIEYINEKYNVNVKQVSEKFANAPEYHDKGLKNIQQMDMADDIQKKFNVNTDVAVNMTKAVERHKRKHKKIDVNEKMSATEKSIVKQINDNYLRE